MQFHCAKKETFLGLGTVEVGGGGLETLGCSFGGLWSRTHLAALVKSLVGGAWRRDTV